MQFVIHAVTGEVDAIPAEGLSLPLCVYVLGAASSVALLPGPRVSGML